MLRAIEPVSYKLATSDPAAFVRRFAGSFERYGFASPASAARAATRRSASRRRRAPRTTT
jgi:hypothetical protein